MARGAADACGEIADQKNQNMSLFPQITHHPEVDGGANMITGLQQGWILPPFQGPDVRLRMSAVMDAMVSAVLYSARSLPSGLVRYVKEE